MGLEGNLKSISLIKVTFAHPFQGLVFYIVLRLGKFSLKRTKPVV